MPAQRRRPVPCVTTTFSLSRQTNAQMELGHTYGEPSAPREDSSAIGAPAPARKPGRRFAPQRAPHALTPAVGNLPLVRVWLLSHGAQTRAGAGRSHARLDGTRHEPGLSAPTPTSSCPLVGPQPRKVHELRRRDRMHSGQRRGTRFNLLQVCGAPRSTLLLMFTHTISRENY